MSEESTTSFPPGVADKLNYYVYRLIDPRNGETFYVGKGKGDRVFAHVAGLPDEASDELGEKLKRIWEIQVAGFRVAHVIHRHGMDEKTAFHVESALIDAYPGLTNSAGGTDNDFGAMHALEIIKRYCAEPAVFRHRAILISVNRSSAEHSLYDAVRYAWIMSKSRAAKAEVVLATRQGEIVGEFVPHRWLDASEMQLPGRPAAPGRVGFEGVEAPTDIKSLYVGKRVPDEYRRPGAANPIKYTW